MEELKSFLPIEDENAVWKIKTKEKELKMQE